MWHTCRPLRFNTLPQAVPYSIPYDTDLCRCLVCRPALLRFRPHAPDVAALYLASGAPVAADAPHPTAQHSADGRAPDSAVSTDARQQRCRALTRTTAGSGAPQTMAAARTLPPHAQPAAGQSAST
jgi:hypothetical protein